MKSNCCYLILILGVSLILASCAKEEEEFPYNPELIGKWQLAEQLLDPGDGSGEFQPVTSIKTIKFFSDGKVASNSTLCYMETDGGNQNFTGTYDPDAEVITPDNCPDGASFDIHYELNGGELVLYYLCREKCAQKYFILE